MNVLFIVQYIIVRRFFETKSLQQQINGVIPNMKKTLFEYLKTKRVDLSSSQRFFLLWYDVDKNKKMYKIYNTLQLRVGMYLLGIDETSIINPYESFVIERWTTNIIVVANKRWPNNSFINLLSVQYLYSYIVK